MKTFTKLISIALLSSVSLVATADTSNAQLGISAITPAVCGVPNSSGYVLVMLSQVPGRDFLACNAQIVKQNPAYAQILKGSNGNKNLPSPWVVNPDGNESYICRGPLNECEVMYSK